MTTTTDITYLCGCEASGDNVSPFCPMHGKPIAKDNTTMTTTADLEADDVNSQNAGSLSELEKAAKELAEYASYAEIVGGISVNRPPIRHWCDRIFELLHK